jgi:hypothetical protein
MATANLTDMSILATDTVFGNRILMSLVQYCVVTVAGSESITTSTVQIHIARKAYAAQALNNPTLYKPLFINAVAANQTVANDATAGGTLVGKTAAQVATAAALCTDTDINNATATAFNAFVSTI